MHKIFIVRCVVFFYTLMKNTLLLPNIGEKGQEEQHTG